MCGVSRPSAGGRIAVMFPSQQEAGPTSPYSLFFRESTDRTRAIFEFDDPVTLTTLQRCKRLGLRIERYGDLTNETSTTAPPLHQFSLENQSPNTNPNRNSTGMEFELPERLDLGVSERGIVGRQVTLVSEMGETLGRGIVGFN